MWRQRLTRRFSQRFRNREILDKKLEESQFIEETEGLPKLPKIEKSENEVLNIKHRHLTLKEDVRGKELRNLIRNGHSTYLFKVSIYSYR